MEIGDFESFFVQFFLQIISDYHETILVLLMIECLSLILVELAFGIVGGNLLHFLDVSFEFLGFLDLLSELVTFILLCLDFFLQQSDGVVLLFHVPSHAVCFGSCLVNLFPHSG